jgi:hypothetical protein
MRDMIGPLCYPSTICKSSNALHGFSFSGADKAGRIQLRVPGWFLLARFSWKHALFGAAGSSLQAVAGRLNIEEVRKRALLIEWQLNDGNSHVHFDCRSAIIRHSLCRP